MMEDCARFVVERGIDVDALFTDQWQLSQGIEAYEHFDHQSSGKGAFTPHV
jgi:L-iditol 2-dehydrogenase